ncbi:MAG TPA: hypothetical protein VJR92_00935, partial [Gemmatimonadaceae bacterium]|nr:hypothetical protein [Gemmatimonadaceae bacterium]
MIAKVLRVFAILIALAAAIDPAITSNRKTKPEIAVVAADARDSALAARVARELARRYTIVRAPFARAAGTVIVGDRLPPNSAELATPVFAVTPDESGIAIERIQS